MIMRSFISEEKREIPLKGNYEVVVAGGGIAGIAAGMAAARCGKKVLLIEREYGLGGMATLGLVTIYLPLCDGNGTQVSFGIAEELLKFSIRHGCEENYPKAWIEGGSDEERIKHRYLAQFNPHFFSLSVEEMLEEMGIDILFGSVICGAEVSDGFIKALIIENKSGRTAIEAGSVIDCTGDADICAMAGAKTELHKGGNGLASWYYYFTEGKYHLKMFGLADLVTKMDEKDGQDYHAEKTESLDTMRFSGVDGYELSKAVIKARRKMYYDILDRQKADPSYAPVTTSTIPLVRMSRRLSGIRTLDYSEDHKFQSDSIGMIGDWRKKGPVFELPFGTLYGKEVRNLLAAGRDISVTDDMWDVTRVIPACAVTGEAAGTAAGLYEDLAKADVVELQKKLVSQGVKLHLE